jgi:homoserine dehydrogenase
VVVELMGGLEPARTLVLAAIAKRKPVVTANKALLAHHGPEIFAAAREAGVDVAFEGSVGGGIPVVRTLRDALAGDAVKRLVAILNGTSNYVLTRMQREGLGFDEVVREAQRLGYAEADPSLDVDGHDAAHKLTVLSMLAFGARVDPSSIPTTGLRALEPVDHTSADRFGYVVKPLAVAEDVGPSLSLRVGPTLVRKDALLASVSGVLNAVLLEGNALGPCVLSGRGAGDGPTAVSVVSDLLDVARARRAKSEGLLTAAVRAEPRRVRDAGEAVSPYYLRFVVKDRPGVLGRITTALGGSGVSIREVVQQGRGSAEIPVDVVMLTHASSLASVTEALAVVDAEAFTVEPTRVLPVEEG